MQSDESAQCLLLELPDPCLLAVLQCCAADDLRSLFSAASAHSRLHQAALAVLSSITAITPQQHHVDGVLLFLSKHSQHVRSVTLKGAGRTVIDILQLPSTLQLSSLQLEGFDLRPVPCGQRTLRSAAAFKQLRLRDCQLLTMMPDGEKALEVLPAGLEHLSINSSKQRGGLWSSGRTWPGGMFHTVALQQLLQLTYLELAGVCLQGHFNTQHHLEPVEAMTKLLDLRLGTTEVPASMLSDTHHLTRMEVTSCLFEPGALAGKTKLQHLHLQLCNMTDAGGPAQLLYHLQDLQQLTHLVVQENREAEENANNPPAAAYSALTASSKLQHLDVSSCTLPEGVWQHVFPAGRQLPHLQHLAVSWLTEPSGSAAPAPEGLVSCCPGLRSLDLRGLHCSAHLPASLQGLSRLHTLRLFDDENHTAAAAVPTVCQLTRLRELDLVCLSVWDEGMLLLLLTQLQQLTVLEYTGPLDENHASVHFTRKGASDEPVWRQILQCHLNHSNPGVAQQAATALAE